MEVKDAERITEVGDEFEEELDRALASAVARVNDKIGGIVQDSTVVLQELVALNRLGAKSGNTRLASSCRELLHLFGGVRQEIENKTVKYVTNDDEVTKRWRGVTEGVSSRPGIRYWKIGHGRVASRRPGVKKWRIGKWQSEAGTE